MRILIESISYENYLAKCHEAFRTGLRAFFDTRCFGKGYSGYWPFFKSYSQIVKHKFPDSSPDFVIADCYYPFDPLGFKYRDITGIKARRIVILGDYWDMANKVNEYVEFILANKIDFILTYFPQPMTIWAGTPIENRFIYMPPSFDPAIFNDWQMKKIYDVGFLAAGTVEPHKFYPERYDIHQQLLGKNSLKYLWADHPGWRHKKRHPLMGKNFSRAINSCKMFITSGGILQNANAKYVEILASKTLLLADEPVGWERLRLEDGINYVKITKEDVIEKVDYYLSKPNLAEEIAQRGYATALQYHNCYVRAAEFFESVTKGKKIACLQS